jgi:hypothetical protein
MTALREKRVGEASGDDALVRWLDHDLAQIEDSLRWFAALAPGGSE